MAAYPRLASKHLKTLLNNKVNSGEVTAAQLARLTEDDVYTMNEMTNAEVHEYVFQQLLETPAQRRDRMQRRAATVANATATARQGMDDRRNVVLGRPVGLGFGRAKRMSRKRKVRTLSRKRKSRR